MRCLETHSEEVWYAEFRKQMSKDEQAGMHITDINDLWTKLEFEETHAVRIGMSSSQRIHAIEHSSRKRTRYDNHDDRRERSGRSDRDSSDTQRNQSDRDADTSHRLAESHRYKNEILQLSMRSKQSTRVMMKLFQTKRHRTVLWIGPRIRGSCRFGYPPSPTIRTLLRVAMKIVMKIVLLLFSGNGSPLRPYSPIGSGCLCVLLRYMNSLYLFHGRS